MRNGGPGDADVTPKFWHYTPEAGYRAEVAMGKLIRCECGFTARGDDENLLVDAIQRHLAADHPALADAVTREDIHSWIQTE